MKRHSSKSFQKINLINMMIRKSDEFHETLKNSQPPHTDL